MLAKCSTGLTVSGTQNEQIFFFRIIWNNIPSDSSGGKKNLKRTLKWKLPLLLSVKTVIHRILVYVNIQKKKKKNSNVV